MEGLMAWRGRPEPLHRPGALANAAALLLRCGRIAAKARTTDGRFCIDCRSGGRRLSARCAHWVNTGDELERSLRVAYALDEGSLERSAEAGGRCSLAGVRIG